MATDSKISRYSRTVLPWISRQQKYEIVDITCLLSPLIDWVCMMRVGGSILTTNPTQPGVSGCPWTKGKECARWRWAWAGLVGRSLDTVSGAYPAPVLHHCAGCGTTTNCGVHLELLVLRSVPVYEYYSIID